MTIDLARYAPSLVSTLRQLMRIGATWTVRALIVAVSLTALGFGLYRQAWVPLHEAAELPAGVTPTNPALDAHVLQHINGQRISRQQNAPSDYAREGLFFSPLPQKQ